MNKKKKHQGVLKNEKIGTMLVIEKTVLQEIEKMKKQIKELEEEIKRNEKNISNLQNKTDKDRVTVNIIGEGQHALLERYIYFIETEKHSILIHTKHGMKRCNNSMGYMESQLDKKRFYRCHNSYIVNLDEIRYLKETVIYMKNGMDLDVSQRKLSEFKRAYLKRRYAYTNMQKIQ